MARLVCPKPRQATRPHDRRFWPGEQRRDLTARKASCSGDRLVCRSVYSPRGKLRGMSLIVILVILLLLFGGGGYYMGPGLGYYGGGGLSLVLLIVILFLLFGRGRGRL
jgi:hypothetical protein